MSDVLFFVLIPLGYVYCALISKMLPLTGFAVLDGIARDRYFVLLIPLTLPVFVFVVFINWHALKYFRGEEKDKARESRHQAIHCSHPPLLAN